MVTDHLDLSYLSQSFSLIGKCFWSCFWFWSSWLALQLAFLKHCIAIAMKFCCNWYCIALHCNRSGTGVQDHDEKGGWWLDEGVSSHDWPSLNLPLPYAQFYCVPLLSADFQCNSLLSAVCMFFNCITLPCATANCISKQSCNVLLPGNAILWSHIPFCTAVSTELCTTKLQCCALSHTVHRTGKALLLTVLHWTATVPSTPTQSCNGEMAWRFPLKD